MRKLTRMLVLTTLSLVPVFAVAGDSMSSHDGMNDKAMMSDDGMKKEMSGKTMKENDMAADMEKKSMDGHNMDGMGKSNGQDMSMEMDAHTMDDKDSMH